MTGQIGNFQCEKIANLATDRLSNLNLQAQTLENCQSGQSAQLGLFVEVGWVDVAAGAAGGIHARAG